MRNSIRIEGRHADLASPEAIADGIRAALEVFNRNGVESSDCAAAIQKYHRAELLSPEEAFLCVVWDEAEEAAFKQITLGWLSRDVEIQIAVC